MMHAVVISNGIEGLERFFRSSDAVSYRFEKIGADFDPDLGDADILIVPNGSDHVAMLRIREKVRAFLDRGNGVLCFDGWFTDWLPGNRWMMDNTRPTREIRYAVRTDRHRLFDGVDIDGLTFSHGISGWWACGHIEPAPGADVIMEDTWGRAMMVLDETTTPGTMIMTASGPLGDASHGGEPGAIGRLYMNLLTFLARKGAHHA